MKSLIKFVAGGILSTALLASSVLSVGACNCYYGNCNYNDVNGGYYLGPGNNSAVQFGGSKNNSSSVYFKHNTSSSFYSIRVAVFGVDTNSSSQPNKTCNKAGKEVGYVTVIRGNEYEIYNHINESGFNKAGVALGNNHSWVGNVSYT